ncbi:hypothetical protein COL5a_010525 [Colletotrichum fioriniae]|nr:hypothetical protein COL5a_010525 [Colletotrichum fioriniae]
MCFTQKTIHTVCAHSAVELIECRKFIGNKDKTYRNACTVPLCQHTQALATVIGFCQNCEAFYRDSDVSSVNASELLENYWKFKAVKKWHCPVDPLMIPASALTETSMELPSSCNAEDVNRGDYGNESALSSGTAQTPRPVAFISPALPAQSSPSRRLNIHERREIEFQERQKLFAELAANHQKDIQRLREQAELEIRAEEEFRKEIAASSDTTGVTASSSSVISDHLPRSPSSSADIASAFPSFSGVHCPLIDTDEHGEDDASLHPLDYDESAYEALTGGTNEIRDVLELRQATIVKPEYGTNLHSYHGEIDDIEEEDSNDPANCFSASDENRSSENEAPGTENGKGKNIAGPSHPESLNSAPLSGPEIRQRAPPRRPRGPMYCAEHAGERDPECHGCQAGCWVEIGLPPGEHVEETEPGLI